MIQNCSNLSLKDRIAEMLRAEIAAGRMADGEELTQERVSDALAVSRIPVREAFLQLEADGLLRRLPNRHVQVVGVTAKRLRQNFRVLASLECELARLVAEEGDFSLALDRLEALRAADTWADRVRCDTSFHLALGASLDNPTLAQLHSGQRRGLFAGALDRLPPEGVPLRDLDDALEDSLRARDGAALCRKIRAYYETVCEAVLKEMMP